MSFIEEIKNQTGARAKAEEIVKQAVRDRIMEYTKMAGWSHNRANFGGSEFAYLLLKDRSGWTEYESVSALKFHEVMEATSFIIDFLQREGFQVETKCSWSGVDFIITWEKN